MGLFWGAKFPYFNMQELNLDWFLSEIKRIMGWFPDSGNPGQVLMKTQDGTAWEDLESVDLNINNLPEDTEITDTDKLIFYDLSATANRKITPPNLLNSMMSNATPLMDGTGSAGTSKKPARYDHRHPTDTSRAPASYFQNNALKVANGGTGAANASDARDNLGLGDCAVEDVLPIAKGGTGATTLDNARKAFGLHTGTIPSNSNVDIDLAEIGKEGVIFFSSRAATGRGATIFYMATDNALTLTHIVEPTLLTFTSSGTVLNIANGSSTYRVDFEVFIIHS